MRKPKEYSVEFTVKMKLTASSNSAATAALQELRSHPLCVSGSMGGSIRLVTSSFTVSNIRERWMAEFMKARSIFNLKKALRENLSKSSTSL
jgi:hypothetical protein